MPVDYDQIREENIRYYGEGDRHLFFLQELYDRRTHFVFELLQNADDARATEIEFVVHADRLGVGLGRLVGLHLLGFRLGLRLLLASE